MDILEITPEHPHWTELVAHLKRVNMLRYVNEALTSQPSNLHILGAAIGSAVVGHISLEVREIAIPATPWSGGQATPITDAAGAPVRETFVETFAVEADQRRRGYGRALQVAALELTKSLGGYQMRSWSSADKTANYALKLGLGFSVYPATQISASGEEISGVYFLKTV